MSIEKLTAIGEAAVAKSNGAVSAFELAYGELTLLADRDRIVEVLKLLRDDAEFRFVQLIDLTAVDYPERARRFDVVYHLLSLTKNLRVRIKVQTDEETPVSTITSVFPVADWFEREAFDMYGVLFAGHPDLRRLLTDYGFTGFPLRKDFPMTGYVEVRWDEEQKRVVYEPVKLTQEFRQFDFLSPWEGAKYVLPGDEKAKG
ncbi:NADH-quinone oxidoreductase subunit C [Caulobacter sp. 17J65-9]|uniref:NADH-quinone oxidoreductase subunit C n=1 Tax=Caulobacter sp. 17J65-9 TaxID=2709382 RepID=UPI0013CDC449|nr:NADH-quinone oxidoreductase subunit C [Caulobacter sp. 17J65-9]NEX93791.1 NADH-quinone oxidoreductase subunit C [Caulobacter sp. 17J65-9]